ncbi:MAG: hypothetical protein HZB38_04835 [Planctomycetes bacterium]|nr:hypothetical protein [Planctomycetota bacterium]
MPFIAGIDEAGYGPTLGPLVVGASLWRVEPAKIDADFWSVLGEAATRTSKRGDWRLVVDDSKSVFDRHAGIGSLERTVLAFAAAGGHAAGSLDQLLAWLGVSDLAAGAIPWYRDLRIDLPLDRARASSAAVVERLAQTMAEQKVACVALRTAVVPEDAFNQRVARTRNKAELVVEHVLRHIAWAGAQARDADLIVFVDRLGGRSEYRGLLSMAFPDRHVHVQESTPERSRYRLASAKSDWIVEFGVDADKLRMPVALASMTAKYVREALMERFNEFWRQWVPGLKPTAGYYTDAQRFLTDLGPAVMQAGVSVNWPHALALGVLIRALTRCFLACRFATLVLE